MLRPDRSIERVYLHPAPVDMRKQIDGLVILAQDVIQQDPTSGVLFAFINARRNKLKLLVWERNGFVIWYKRLERDKFHWPRGVGSNRRDSAWIMSSFWDATLFPATGLYSPGGDFISEDATLFRAHTCPGDRNQTIRRSHSWRDSEAGRHPCP